MTFFVLKHFKLPLLIGDMFKLWMDLNKALNNGIADVAGAAVKGWINSPGHERRHVDDMWIRVRGTSVLTVVMNC